MSSVKESVLDRFALSREHGYGLKQEDYIYDVYWSKEADKLFIELLLEQHAAGKFNPRDLDEEALEFSMDAVNHELNTDFGMDCWFDRLEMLERRHSVFSYIVEKHGVKYDAAENRVYAALNVWDELLKWDDFTMAYMEFGDPELVSLQILFKRPTPSATLQANFMYIADDEGPNKEIINIDCDEEVKIDPHRSKMKKVLSTSSKNIKKTLTPWSSTSRSFWKYLEDLEALSFLTSESSINQPTPAKNSSNGHVVAACPSGSNVPAVRELFPPSPAKTISTAASTTQKN